MSKKILSIMIVIVFLFLSVSNVLASGEPTITVESLTVDPGENIVLSVKTKNNPGINTFSFGFDYDETKLSLENVSLSKSLDGQFAYKTKAVWLNSKDTKYDGEILKLTFKVLSSAKVGDTKVNLTYSLGDISNYNEENVNFKLVPGTVTIVINDSTVSSIITLLQKLIVFVRNFYSKVY